MKRIQEMTIFLNPVDSSYSRLGKNDAPKYVTWSYQNRAQLIRVSKTINEHSWMELRSPDPMCNAYIGFALILNAGLDGIEEKAILPEAVDLNLNKADKETLDKYETLPESFEAAALLADNSDFINKYVPKIIKDAVLNQTL